MAKEYDYLLKVLLVGDSDVGKTEILNNLDQEDQEGGDSAFYEKRSKLWNSQSILFSLTSVSATCKTTIILLDGKRVKLQVSVI